jgi:hypothetical protein
VYKVFVLLLKKKREEERTKKTEEVPAVQKNLAAKKESYCY